MFQHLIPIMVGDKKGNVKYSGDHLLHILLDNDRLFRRGLAADKEGSDHDTGKQYDKCLFTSVAPPNSLFPCL